MDLYDMSEVIARNFWNRNYNMMRIPIEKESTAAEQLIGLGASMLRHRANVLSGGSFVTAFVDNDLREAVGRADATSILGFRYFAMLLYNCTLSEHDPYIK